MVWNGGIWTSEDDGPIFQLFWKSLDKRIATLTTETPEGVAKFLKGSRNVVKTKNALKAVSTMPEIRKSTIEFDQDWNRLAVQGGEIDLVSGEFGPPNPKSYCSHQAGTKYDPKAVAPKWEKFLLSIFSDDKELVRWIQKAVGYSLTGYVSEQIMFVCAGDGANGKSTFLEVLRALFKGYGAVANFSTFDSKTRGDQTNDLARLKGKRFVTIVESEEDAYLAESKIKTATGDEAISCRFLYKEFFEYLPQFKVWMAVNREPQIKGNDLGIKRRIVNIPFEKRFDGADRVSNMKEQLLEELAGILNWALEGLKMWREEGLKKDLPKKIQSAVEEYAQDMDVMGMWLAEKTEKISDKQYTRGTELYTSYKTWMQSMGLKPKAATRWGRDLSARGINKRRDGVGVKYFGIGLTESWVEDYIPQPRMKEVKEI
jgi:putative DNA primase/helicase